MSETETDVEKFKRLQEQWLGDYGGRLGANSAEGWAELISSDDGRGLRELEPAERERFWHVFDYGFSLGAQWVAMGYVELRKELSQGDQT